MGQKLSQKDKELYRRIDEILYYQWDPIGVSDVVWSRDEYQNYLPTVFKLVLEKSNKEEIEDYLSKVVTDQMGLRSDKKHNMKIVDMFFDLRDCIEDKPSDKE